MPQISKAAVNGYVFSIITMAKRHSTARGKLTYHDAGVDVAANDRMVEKIRHTMFETYGPRVLSGHGGFAGLMRLDFSERLLKRRYRDPVLVAGTDGVGSKLLLALEHGRLADLGIDLVAMSVNDILTTGAEPLFFLDYIACHRLVPDQIAVLVEGIAKGCRQAGCALLGGETAEMPALYAAGHFDLAGFCVGVIDRHRLIDNQRVEPGDVVLGLASDGLHSNGYSLVREALKRLPKHHNPRSSPAAGDGLRDCPEHLPVDLGEPLIDALLRPTRIYVQSVLKVLSRYRRKKVVRAMAHITGGGLEGNIPRVIPDQCDLVLDRDSWPVPPIFRLIEKLGVDREEMFRVFNMGIGYVLIVRPAFADSLCRQLDKLGEKTYRIGSIRRGHGRLLWREDD